MGRITIFATDECPHCKRTKGFLKERGIPYTEISLSTHPWRRNDMLSLSDRLTVPQVFFNDQYIGGAEETLRVLAEWEKDGDPAFAETPLEIYQTTIGALPDPIDPRLGISTEPPVEPKAPPPRPESDRIEWPDGTLSSVLDVVQKLKECLPRDDLSYRMKIYTNCFTGAAAVRAWTKTLDCDEEAAVAFGRRLEARQLLHHVVNQHSFGNTEDYYFRLQCYQTPQIINSYRIWTEPADPDAVGLVHRLKKLLGQIESSVTNNNGEVNYKAAVEHPLFPKLDEAICELQTLNLGELDQNTIIAFLLNLYNLGIKFAFMKVGIGSTSISRSSFFTSIQFNIGGLLYSFQDIENGILRGNRRAPYSLSKPISQSDPRHAFVLKPQEVDCRIHFALNCGAKSCPPVKSFTADAIEEELRIVAQAFCEDDNNVQVDTENCVLFLNKILSWYMVDFAPSEEELPAKIATFLRGSKKEQLEQMIHSDTQNFAIKFLPYDWATNASDFVSFDAGSLLPEYYSVRALF